MDLVLDRTCVCVISATVRFISLDTWYKLGLFSFFQKKRFTRSTLVLSDTSAGYVMPKLQSMSLRLPQNPENACDRIRKLADNCRWAANRSSFWHKVLTCFAERSLQANMSLRCRNSGTGLQGFCVYNALRSKSWTLLSTSGEPTKVS